METSESTCSNKGTLSEHVHVTNGRDDDISHNLEEPELTNANVNDEERSETVTKSAQNLDEGTRSQKLTEKGNKEKIKCLKQKRTTALLAVTRKRTDITKLMTDTNNLDVVKTELTKLDILCEQFEYTQNLYLEESDLPEDKERASRHYADEENDIFENRKQVANWIMSCEEQIGNHFDGLSDTSKRSCKSRLSRTSQSSISLQSARLKEKGKVAELMAERSMLQEKLKLQLAEEQLQLQKMAWYKTLKSRQHQQHTCVPSPRFTSFTLHKALVNRMGIPHSGEGGGMLRYLNQQIGLWTLNLPQGRNAPWTDLVLCNNTFSSCRFHKGFPKVFSIRFFNVCEFVTMFLTRLDKCKYYLV